jgi:diaminopimelate decarboxylase
MREIIRTKHGENAFNEILEYITKNSASINSDKVYEKVIGEILLLKVVIHDAGAHGRAMGFNYNGKLRCGELLLRPDGSVLQIRRPETAEDYFATLDLQGVKKFE